MEAVADAAIPHLLAAEVPAVAASVAWADQQMLRAVSRVLIEAILTVAFERPGGAALLSRIGSAMHERAEGDLDTGERGTPRMRVEVATSVHKMADTLAGTKVPPLRSEGA